MLTSLEKLSAQKDFFQVFLCIVLSFRILLNSSSKRKRKNGSEFWSHLFERAVSDGLIAKVLMMGYYFSVAKCKLKSLH